METIALLRRRQTSKKYRGDSFTNVYDVWGRVRLRKFWRFQRGAEELNACLAKHRDGFILASFDSQYRGVFTLRYGQYLPNEI